MSETHLDICRLCSSKQYLVCLFQGKSRDTRGFIRKLIYDTVGINLDPFDNFSKRVCLNCCIDVFNFYNFKEDCIKNERRYKEWGAQFSTNFKPRHPKAKYPNMDSYKLPSHEEVVAVLANWLDQKVKETNTIPGQFKNTETSLSQCDKIIKKVHMSVQTSVIKNKVAKKWVQTDCINKKDVTIQTESKKNELYLDRAVQTDKRFSFDKHTTVQTQTDLKLKNEPDKPKLAKNTQTLKLKTVTIQTQTRFLTADPETPASHETCYNLRAELKTSKSEHTDITEANKTSYPMCENVEMKTAESIGSVREKDILSRSPTKNDAFNFGNRVKNTGPRTKTFYKLDEEDAATSKKMSEVREDTKAVTKLLESPRKKTILRSFSALSHSTQNSMLLQANQDSTLSSKVNMETAPTEDLVKSKTVRGLELPDSPTCSNTRVNFSHKDVPVVTHESQSESPDVKEHKGIRKLRLKRLTQKSSTDILQNQSGNASTSQQRIGDSNVSKLTKTAEFPSDIEKDEIYSSNSLDTSTIKESVIASVITATKPLTKKSHHQRSAMQCKPTTHHSKEPEQSQWGIVNPSTTESEEASDSEVSLNTKKGHKRHKQLNYEKNIGKKPKLTSQHPIEKSIHSVSDTEVEEVLSPTNLELSINTNAPKEVATSSSPRKTQPLVSPKTPTNAELLNDEVKKQIVWLCKICEAVLYSKKEYISHSRIHMQCKFCKKRFKSFKSLNVHMTECQANHIPGFHCRQAYVGIVRLEQFSEYKDTYEKAVRIMKRRNLL